MSGERERLLDRLLSSDITAEQALRELRAVRDDANAPFDAAECIVGSRPAIADGLRALLDTCETYAPDPVWAELARLDYAGDAARLATWFDTLLRDEPPPAEIVGYYFGLVEWVLPAYASVEARDYSGTAGAASEAIGETTGGLYVCGSTDFDRDDGGEWAVHPQYWPERRYADSTILRDVYRRVSGEGDHIFHLATNVLCVGYVGLAARLMCERERTRLIGPAKWCGVGVGYDSGDCVVVGRLERRGWH